MSVLDALATEGGPDDSADPYAAFAAAVADAQLAAWLPAQPSRVIDLSATHAHFALQAVAAGHEVVHVLGETHRLDDAIRATAARGPGRLLPVTADLRHLNWLAEASADAVLAEGRTLSSCLAAEVTLAAIARALRPGGRLLLCVDSLLHGLARLAELGRWAELADVPAADVVLVPGPDEHITRCFWPEELRALLEEVGLEVQWVRPRTVIGEEAVRRALRADPGSLSTLVKTELTLAAEREGDTNGSRLVASARRPR